MADQKPGADLRDLPLIERKRQLTKLIGRGKRRSIRLTVHLTGDGPTVFEHVCRMGLEGIVSSERMRPTAAARQARGSSRKTRRARRCAASARRSGAKAELRSLNNGVPPDQCLHSAEADVRPPRRKSGFGPLSEVAA
jgi:hypothetical protein